MGKEYYCLGCGVNRQAHHFKTALHVPKEGDLNFFKKNIKDLLCKDVKICNTKHLLTVKDFSKIQNTKHERTLQFI